MHPLIRAIVVTSTILSAGAGAVAAERTVTITVENMTCATCPIAVRKSLTQVPGVVKVNVSLEKEEAVVSFEDTKATAADLIKATTNAGYPSRLKAP